MAINKPKENPSQDGLQIFDLLNEIYLKFNPYDNLDNYVKECKKQFANIENEKNIEPIIDDLFRRWANGQIDSLMEQNKIPDRNKIISFLKNGVFVITDYQYLFYKMTCL